MSPFASREYLPVRLRVQHNERVHKVFILHALALDRQRGLGSDFRVLTKEKSDGNIELLGYAYSFDGTHERQSSVLRAPSVPAAQLITLIRRVVEQTGADIRQMEVMDLTTEPTRLDQADRLAQHDLLEAFEFEQEPR